MTKCQDCGRESTYSICDLCWEHTLREVADRHARALAEREKEGEDGC